MINDVEILNVDNDIKQKSKIIVTTSMCEASKRYVRFDKLNESHYKCNA